MSEQSATTQANDPASRVRDYVEAIQSKDLDRCMTFYTDDAVLHFMTGVFRGRKSIEEWHRDRFKANFEIVKVEGIRAKADTVSLDASVTSTRLRTWKITSLGGRGTFRLVDGKIREAKFNPRIQNPADKG